MRKRTHLLFLVTWDQLDPRSRLLLAYDWYRMHWTDWYMCMHFDFFAATLALNSFTIPGLVGWSQKGAQGKGLKYIRTLGNRFRAHGKILAQTEARCTHKISSSYHGDQHFSD